MAKDSETKSTSKKKTDSDKEEKKKTAKKTTSAQKKTSKPKSAPKAGKTTAKKTSPKKTETKKKETKKTTSSTKRSTKQTKTSASTPKQKATAKKKKMSVKDLLSKKFDTWAPEKPFRPEKSEDRTGYIDAPPYITGDNEAEIERKRKLLFKTFELSETMTEEGESGDAEVGSSGSQIPPSAPPPPVMSKDSDPMTTILKLCAVGFVLLVAILIKVSATNQSHYYLKSTNEGVEIWQGIYAPMGKDRLISLPGADKPESILAVYSKQEIYPFIFNYYVRKADELLEKPGMPDFEGIKVNLDKALPYAATEKLRTAAKARRNNIDVMILIYKTEVAVSKETIQDYEAALEYLKEAQALDVDGSKTDLIKQKTAAINASISKLKAEEEKAIEETPQQEAEKATPPQ